MNAAVISILVLISIILIIILTTRLKLHAFISLFIVSLLLAFTTLPADTIIKTIKDGFGEHNGINRLPDNSWCNNRNYSR